jgi:replication-associated recombination protein RarA
MSKSKIDKMRLPNEILVIKNKDKTFHEEWKPNRNIINFPHPYRAILCGPPNSGKTLVIKNILLRAKPMFKEVYIIHYDCNTKEYDDIGATFLTEFPPLEFWEGKNKTLVIIDDISFKDLNKSQNAILDRLYGYISTHRNVSLLLTSQDMFNIPSIVRRCSNLFILWKPRDIDSLTTIGRRTGMNGKELRILFNDLIHTRTDSLWIDLTKDSPYMLRKNGFELITKED